MKPTVFLVNNRDAIVDLSMIQDTLGKPVTLRPRGHAGDCRECFDVVAQHSHVKAVVKAGWVSLKMPAVAAPKPAPAPAPVVSPVKAPVVVEAVAVEAPVVEPEPAVEAPVAAPAVEEVVEAPQPTAAPYESRKKRRG
jgi:hypothetical protein